MSEYRQEFPIGAEVTGQDGPLGTLTRVVIDPIRRAVTHLVVEPAGRVGLGRLVPVERAETDGETINLHLDASGFEHLPLAEETYFVPIQLQGVQGFGAGQAWGWPYYGLGAWDHGANVDEFGAGNAPQPVIADRIPPGETEIHRGERVRATDGEIGKVQGLIIDPRDHRVTHVLLAEGHLWGKKEVAIPITAVTSIVNGIEVDLTRDEIRDLPPVEHTELEGANRAA